LNISNKIKLPQKRWQIIAISLVALLIAFIAFKIVTNLSREKERAARALAGRTVTVEAATVGRRDLAPAFSFSANLEALWTTDVSTKADGRIERLFVEEGDAVTAGMTVARLDVNELAAQVMQAEGQVLQARATLEQNELNFQRMDLLYQKNAVSAHTLDVARTQRDLARGGVQAAQGNVMLLKARLDNANIISPLNGVVIKRHVQAGTFSKAGIAIFTVADVSTLLAKAVVGEAQISELSVGTPVKITVNALRDQQYKGIVTRLSPAASVPTRTFTAEVSIPNPNNELKVGMYANAEIAGQIRNKVLAIPEGALVMREDQKTVFVVLEGNKVMQRVLKLGDAAGGWVEVHEGVQEGDRIVVAGQHKLKDGAMIRLGAPEGQGTK
jgi:RND family efflux transporter MFP subunit